MRIMKGKSKDPTYHVIQDVRRNGKRSTEIIENLGHASEICKKYNVSDADAWANEYIQNLRNNSSNANHKFLVPFYTDSIIKSGKQLSFNAGYLFLQKIYYQLGIDSICRKIKKDNSFNYDLDAILWQNSLSFFQIIFF